jgi:hypothetical protein
VGCHILVNGLSSATALWHGIVERQASVLAVSACVPCWRLLEDCTKQSSSADWLTGLLKAIVMPALLMASVSAAC